MARTIIIRSKLYGARLSVRFRRNRWSAGENDNDEFDYRPIYRRTSDSTINRVVPLWRRKN